MNTTYDIQPTNCGPLGTADKIRIVVTGFNILDDKCTVSYSLIDTINQRVIADGFRIMEGNDYANWGSDNTYVKNWLLNLLGITAA